MMSTEPDHAEYASNEDPGCGNYGRCMQGATTRMGRHIGR